MKTIEHIYAIKNLLSSGPSSDDFNYSNRLILHYLQIARARLIEQKADKYHFISDQSFQSLCVPLELANYHDCCEGPDLGCLVLKSKIEIPKFLNTRWGSFIQVTDLEGNNLSQTTIVQNNLSEYSITNTDPKPGWLINNNKLIILNSNLLMMVLLNGLFSDPAAISASNCTNAQNDCVDEWETEFPIDSDLIDPMYRVTLEFLGRAIMTYPQDLENNAKEEINATK